VQPKQSGWCERRAIEEKVTWGEGRKRSRPGKTISEVRRVLEVIVPKKECAGIGWKGEGNCAPSREGSA